MRNLGLVTRDIKDSDGLKGVIKVYEELAALRMQKIREKILDAREFFSGLSQVLTEVGVDIEKGVKKNNKKAVVLISANAGLYGDIIDKVFLKFIDYALKEKAEVFIVGTVGAELMRQFAPRQKFTLLNLADEGLNMKVFGQVVKELSGFNQVKVFYGRFDNIVVQTETSRDLSSEMLSKLFMKEEDKALDRQKLQYLYEPSVEAVAEKFSREIFASVLEQTIRESQLAKNASRLMRLDTAVEKIDEVLVDLERERMRVERRMESKKQGLRVNRVRVGARQGGSYG